LPNPALAGILSLLPGMGAVYCAQYAKGLAHFLIFVGIIVGLTHGILPVFLGIGLAFFYVYQIIDAVRTAHAVQAGMPVPDPFGLASTFSAVDPRPATGYATAPVSPEPAKIPTAAVILIGLGVLFLLQTAGVFSFDFDRIWPLILIGLGAWLIAVRLGYLGSKRFSTRRSWTGPAVLITVGVLSLIESMGGPEWGKTWPVLLLAIGATKLIDRSSPSASATPYMPVDPTSPVAPPSASSDVPPSEVNHG
jgi:hypothetical protein